MIVKELNCDKEQGTFQLKLSEKEMGIRHAIVEVDYMLDEIASRYSVEIFSGSLDGEYLMPLADKYFDVSYKELKDNVIQYVKERLNEWAEQIRKNSATILKPADVIEKIGFIYSIKLADYGEFMAYQIEHDGVCHTEIYWMKDDGVNKIIQINEPCDRNYIKQSIIEYFS